jgi:hypothetical protein
MWVRHLIDTEYTSAIYLLNFGIHEMGHFVFRLFGEFIGVAGGSLLQVAVPIGSMVMFYRRQRDFFAIAFCFAWLATNLYYVAWYMADAQFMSKPLAGEGSNLIHDWNYLFKNTGLLGWSKGIAWMTRQGANVAIGVSAVGMGWLMWKMWGTREEPVRKRASGRG